jgi:hypothetical protein
MGQQQLLLIVLGIIIVSIAVSIANQLFDTNAEDSNKDSIASELINLGMLAQQYYNKPEEMGGGTRSYTEWQIPADLDTTTSGIYLIDHIANYEMVLTGFPFIEKGYKWHLRSVVRKEGITTEVVY